MARRSDHSREEIYENALNAAQNIVETDGFRALTARNVADAIGYSPGTLYNVFENLDDLILHLNGRTLDALHDRLATEPATGHPDADLRRLLDAYLEFLERHTNLWSVLFDFSLPDGRRPPEWYARKIETVLNLLEHALQPLFAADDRQGLGDASRTLWAGLHGICSLSGSGKLQVVTAQSVRAMAMGLVDNYVAGLRAKRKAG